MLLLTSTSDKIRLTTGSALTVDVHASWIDNASGAITPGRTNTAITTATTTDIVASPASSTQRNIKAMSIRNKDSSSDVVTVLHTDGTTTVQLISCTLLTGEELCYDAESGWKHFSASGGVKFDPLQPISDAQLLANTSGSAAAPVGTGVSTYFDYTIANSVGTLLARGSSTWEALASPASPAVASPQFGSPQQFLNTQPSTKPVWASPYSGRNPINYNGGMEIDQANEGAAISTNTSYVVDGYTYAKNGTFVANAQRFSIVTQSFGFISLVKTTVTSGTAVGASDFLGMSHAIEANEIGDTMLGSANAATLCLSFWARATGAGAPYTATAVIRNAAGTRSYIAPFTITSNATWQQFSFVIPGDTTGTWVMSGTASGMILSFLWAAGSTFQGTANTWLSANLIGTSTMTNNLATNAAFDITGIELRVAPYFLPPARQPFALEFLRCQRYYEKSYDVGVALGTVALAGSLITACWGSTVGTYYVMNPYKVSKRTTPTVTTYSTFDGASGKAGYNNASSVSTSVVNIGLNGSTIGLALSPTAGLFATWHFVADARL